MDLINYEQLILKVASLPQPVTMQGIKQFGISRGQWENCIRVCRWMPWVLIVPLHRSATVREYTFTINYELRELCQQHRANFEAKLADKQAISSATGVEPRWAPEPGSATVGLPDSSKKSRPEPRSNVRKRVVQECRRCLALDEQLTELWRSIIQTRREQASRREQTKWSVGYLQVTEANDLVDRVVKLVSAAIEKPKVSCTNNNPLAPTAQDDRDELNSDTDTKKESIQ